MTKRQIIATVLEAVGVLGISAGVGIASLFAGIITLGVGLVVFGVAIERVDR